MAVKIFIRRTIPQDKAKKMIPLFRQMRASAATQSGYSCGCKGGSASRLSTIDYAKRPDTDRNPPKRSMSETGAVEE